MDGQIRVPAGAVAALRLQIPPDARYGRYVRERVAGFAAAAAVPEPDVAEFIIAVAEALANAIEHARSLDAIHVHCWVEDEHLFATVVDRGIGFTVGDHVAEPALPHAYAERGRGLPIMKRCSDVFAVKSAPGQGTAVTLGRAMRHARNRFEHGSGSGHELRHPAPYGELHEPE